jgi:nucleoside-diphosphate-sugar epimerase
MDCRKQTVAPEARILITGAAGFIGNRVVESLLGRGFKNLRCLARPSANVSKLEAILRDHGNRADVEIFRGNLLSRQDCQAAAKDVALVYHLAAGRGEKMIPDAFMNSVVTTRNLLEACHHQGGVRRFVSVSSFSVYTNRKNPRGRLLNEEGPIEVRPELRGDAYTFAKVKQDEIVAEYGRKLDIPFVIVRPGVVYGPGNESIHGRVGIGTFGLFLHLGGSNTVPFTYVDNCAEAVVLAGLEPDVNGEVFNVVDDDLPSSREFLRLYKREVKPFRSVYVPHAVSYALCWLWEGYSAWSEGQLPMAFSRRTWRAYWKRTSYSNAKLKSRLGWKQKVPTAVALGRHFESCRRKVLHD